MDFAKKTRTAFPAESPEEQSKLSHGVREDEVKAELYFYGVDHDYIYIYSKTYTYVSVSNFKGSETDYTDGGQMVVLATTYSYI